MAKRVSEERKRRPTNVVLDSEPPDQPLTPEQVDAFIQMMLGAIQAGSPNESVEDGCAD